MKQKSAKIAIFAIFAIFSRGHAILRLAVSVGWLVGLSVRPSVGLSHLTSAFLSIYSDIWLGEIIAQSFEPWKI